MFTSSAAVLCLLATHALQKEPQDPEVLRPMDVFELEHISDPRIAPDGLEIVFVRHFMDVMNDRKRSNLWIESKQGLRPLTSGLRNDHSPRWSPGGQKLAYVSSAEGSSQIYVRYLDTGETAQLTQLQRSPQNLCWSPDGHWLAFTMMVDAKPAPFLKMPAKPEGAKWAPPAQVIQRVRYRADGAGYLPHAFSHVFVVPATGGTPRQITTGNYHHRGTLAFTQDSRQILFSANRNPGWELESRESEIYAADVITRDLQRLTDRKGPDRNPRISPNGEWVAYLGFDEKGRSVQNSEVHLMRVNGVDQTSFATRIQRSIDDVQWSGNEALVLQYDDQGQTKLARMTLDGVVTELVSDLGGTSLGRPYPGGSYTVSQQGHIAYTYTDSHTPAELAVHMGERTVRHRRFNTDLFLGRELARVEELTCKSSHDGRRIQGWVALPPGFDPQKKYPLILEIHGGPFANYGPRFSMEVQLYAAAGYVTLFVNPRGSTSYGEEFANLIHHAYPGPRL